MVWEFRRPVSPKEIMADDNLESEDEANEQETALLPRSFFQGKDLEVGKTCKIKVEGIFEDEIEVSYVRHKKDKDGKDKDSDDDDDSDDKPRRRRDSDAMRESMREFDAIAPMPGPPPMGAY